MFKNAVELACRAPSLHNSQPWRWVAAGAGLQLHADPSRIGHHTDSTGREVIISCGAVLDHLRVAVGPGWWAATIDRLPSPQNRDHLASLMFSRMESVSDHQRVLAEAIQRRRTDRLPFAAPEPWEALEARLRAVVHNSVADLDVIDDSGRPALADASRRTEWLRVHDSSYQAELLWWTGYSGPQEGVPPSALVSEAEAGRVDVARSFPTAGDGDRRADIERDHSKILVLSTYDDGRRNALQCGEVLSTVLLECTAAGLATCTLTQMIEIHTSREAVRRLIGCTALPQVLIRVGQAPQTASPPPRTPRRALADVLQIR